MSSQLTWLAANSTLDLSGWPSTLTRMPQQRPV